MYLSGNNLPKVGTMTKKAWPSRIVVVWAVNKAHSI
jgi:hypothetical protein